jgi:hypothetical protein
VLFQQDKQALLLQVDFLAAPVVECPAPSFRGFYDLA